MTTPRPRAVACGSFALLLSACASDGMQLEELNSAQSSAKRWRKRWTEYTYRWGDQGTHKTYVFEPQPSLSLTNGAAKRAHIQGPTPVVPARSDADVSEDNYFFVGTRFQAPALTSENAVLAEYTSELSLDFSDDPTLGGASTLKLGFAASPTCTWYRGDVCRQGPEAYLREGYAAGARSADFSMWCTAEESGLAGAPVEVPHSDERNRQLAQRMEFAFGNTDVFKFADDGEISDTWAQANIPDRMSSTDFPDYSNRRVEVERADTNYPHYEINDYEWGTGPVEWTIHENVPAAVSEIVTGSGIEVAKDERGLVEFALDADKVREALNHSMQLDDSNARLRCFLRSHSQGDISEVLSDARDQINQGLLILEPTPLVVLE